MAQRDDTVAMAWILAFVLLAAFIYLTVDIMNGGQRPASYPDRPLASPLAN